MDTTIDKSAKLAEWATAVDEAALAKKVIEREQSLRKEVMALFFPEPKEGVNKEPLANGWELKATYKLERKIDEAVLPAVMVMLREMGQNPDTLVTMKPSLDTKGYKSLVAISPDAARVFDTALTIKPGSPTVELVAPKS